MSLTWIIFGWLSGSAFGALTAWLLFGASVSGSSYSRHEDDLEVANVRKQPSAMVGSRYPAPTLQKLQWLQKFRRLWARGQRRRPYGVRRGSR